MNYCALVITKLQDINFALRIAPFGVNTSTLFGVKNFKLILQQRTICTINDHYLLANFILSINDEFETEETPNTRLLN